jgi:hypothetical protein
LHSRWQHKHIIVGSTCVLQSVIIQPPKKGGTEVDDFLCYDITFGNCMKNYSVLVTTNEHAVIQNSMLNYVEFEKNL